MSSINIKTQLTQDYTRLAGKAASGQVNADDIKTMIQHVTDSMKSGRMDAMTAATAQPILNLLNNTILPEAQSGNTSGVRVSLDQLNGVLSTLDGTKSLSGGRTTGTDDSQAVSQDLTASLTASSGGQVRKLDDGNYLIAKDNNLQIMSPNGKDVLSEMNPQGASSYVFGGKDNQTVNFDSAGKPALVGGTQGTADSKSTYDYQNQNGIAFFLKVGQGAGTSDYSAVKDRWNNAVGERDAAMAMPGGAQREQKYGDSMKNFVMAAIDLAKSPNLSSEQKQALNQAITKAGDAQTAWIGNPTPGTAGAFTEASAALGKLMLSDGVKGLKGL